MSTDNTKTIIGRAELVRFIDYGMVCSAKIDTGAYGSVIHASNIKVEKIDGKSILTCSLLDHPASDKSSPVGFKSFDTVEVMASNGFIEQRYRVPLRFELGGKVIASEFTLTDRSHAPFPVLIGRKAIRSLFLVDVEKFGVHYGRLKELHKNSHHWVSAQKLGESL